MLENDLNSLAWRKLNPQAPFYFFTPQNETLRAEYDKGWSVKDIFKVSGVGMVSGRDDLCFSKSDTQQSLQEFKERIAKFMELERRQQEKNLIYRKIAETGKYNTHKKNYEKQTTIQVIMLNVITALLTFATPTPQASQKAFIVSQEVK